MVTKLEFEPEVKHDNVLWNATEVDKLAIAANQFCQPHNPLSHWHKTTKYTPILENQSVKFIDGSQDKTLREKVAPFLAKVPSNIYHILFNRLISEKFRTPQNARTCFQLVRGMEIALLVTIFFEKL
jgi:hypothetical protein